MKVTKREIILLALVLLAGWIYLSYTYMVTPAVNEIAAMEQRLENAGMRERSARAKINALPGLKDDESAEMRRIDAAKDAFVHEFAEEDIVAFIHDLAMETGLHVNVINAGGVNMTNIDELVQAEETSEKPFLSAELLNWFTAAEDLSNAAFAYSFTLNFIASGYEQLIAFFEGFEIFNKLISVNNVAIKVDIVKEAKAEEPETTYDEYGEPVVIREPAPAEEEDTNIITAPLTGNFTVTIMALDMEAVGEALFPAVEIDDEYEYGKEDPFERDAELWPQEEPEEEENVQNAGYYGY